MGREDLCAEKPHVLISAALSIDATRHGKKDELSEEKLPRKRGEAFGSDAVTKAG